MPSDAQVTLNLNTEEAKRQVRQAIFEGVQDVFDNDIKLEAKQESPVLTGNNRESIDTEVVDAPEGVTATIFSQSGYGGYLETGTKKMSAQPYIFPSFNKFRTKLAEIVGTKIASLKVRGRS